jgi:AmmeMemoRadiSam system protein B
VQIPFLQRVLKKFTSVPMIIGTTEPRTINKLADSIATVLGYESRKTVHCHLNRSVALITPMRPPR